METMATITIDEKIRMAAASDVGTVRKHNEDYFYFSKKHKFFIVCDGMGGHQSGALASRVAGETLRDVLLHPELIDLKRGCEDVDENLPEPARRLIAGVRLANRRILSYGLAHQQMRGMGSTIVAALLHDGWLFSINVGDSRLYRLRHRELSCLTKDHSWLNELLEDEEISENEVKHFRKKNVLTRALGTAPTVKIDLRIENVETNDLYMLCSDGLHNALTDELIQSILSAEHGSLQNMTDKLVQSAKQLNGSDNITGGLFVIASQSGNALAPTLLERTISDETPKVAAYLDKVVKTHYAVQKKGPAFSTKWAVAAGFLLVFLTASAFFLLSDKKTTSASSQTLASALLTQEIASLDKSRQATPISVEEAGSLVLVQVNDAKYLEFLSTIEGVRVLDSVERFRQNLPVYAGRYTWALADSAQRILYQRSDITVRSLAEWDEPINDGAANGNAGSRLPELQARTAANKISKTRGLIYLIGNFNANFYQNASIYIDDARLGDLHTYLESGFYLRPGSFTISIRNANGEVMKSKGNVEVAGGEIIAVEF